MTTAMFEPKAAPNMAYGQTLKIEALKVDNLKVDRAESRLADLHLPLELGIIAALFFVIE